jgi:hypothetical protein
MTSIVLSRPASRQSSTLQQKLDFLASLSGLTCFEKEFVARCRARHTIPPREQAVLEKIWERHGSKARIGGALNG